jgi:VCBS repeat-containing protein
MVIPFIITGKNDAPVFEIGDAPVVSAHAEMPDHTDSASAVTSDVVLPFHDPDFSDVGAGYSIQVMDAAAASGQSVGLPDHDLLMDFLTFGAVSKNFDATTGQATGVFSAPDNVFDYLGAHDSVTLKYTIELTDAHGATASEYVFITITGSNDDPVIACGDQAQEQVIHEQTGVTGAQTSDEACGGLIHFTDVDLTDTPTATVSDQSVCYTPAGGEGTLELTQAQADAIKCAFSIAPTQTGHDGTIAWSYSIPDHQLDFLAQGETVTLVSTVEIDDHNGGTTSTTVTVTVTGANDAPTITASVPDHLIESTSIDPGVSSATATLSLHDVDGVATYDAAALACDGWVDHQNGTFTQTVNFGTATLDTSSNALTFALDNSAADGLAAGCHQQVAFDIPVTDGLSTVSTSVVFTIDGANDAPVLSTVPSGLSVTDPVNGTISFTGLSVSDVDAGGASLSIAVQAVHGTVAPASETGTLADINADLQDGFTYTAPASPTGTDAIAVTVTDNHGATDMFHFIFQQPGCAGGAVLTGTVDNDAIFATAGSDSLTGGAGHDMFVFGSLAGQDVVTDFCHGEDTIQIHSAEIASFNDLLALTSDNNGNAVITVGNDSITLQGLHKAALTASDFHIV